MSARTSRRSSSVFILSVLLFGGVFSDNAPQLLGQTATLTSFGASNVDDFTGLIQAGDGNFYGISTGGNAADWACQDIPANSCTYIDKITPSGVVTQLHTFERAPGDTTTPYDANQLIEGSDGFLYGTTQQGGDGFGYGTIFRLTNYGVFTILYTFPGDTTNGPTNGYAPGPLTQGEDGNFYGIASGVAGNTVGVVFFSMTTGGVVTILHQAAATDGQILTDPENQRPGSVLQGSDGNFYTNTSAGFLQFTPSGQVTNILPYTVSASSLNAPTGPVVEGPDFNYYATSPYTTLAPDGEAGDGAIYKLSTLGTMQKLYTLSGGTDGHDLNGDLTLGSDGNLYGTTYWGGNLACSTSPGIAGCGTIFEIGTSGGFHSLYAFSDTVVDGDRPVGPLVQDGSGNFNGTTFDNFGKNIFVAALSTPIPAPIQLSFNPTTVSPGNPTLLTWSVLNAFSRTMRQCHATIQGYPSGGGQWSGSQLGGFPNNTGNIYTGTAPITPTAPGTYVYSLTCGGRESGYATLVVDNKLNVPPALPNGLVGTAYDMSISEFSGVPPYTTTVTAGTLPAGLTLNPATGVLQGTPTQFGTFTLGLQVVDSDSPKATATGTTILSVKSSLAVTTTALPNGTIDEMYSQTLKATGGVPPYVWSLTAGTLPNGITLAASTGVISGTPTKEETQNITLQVADSEGTPATSSVSLPLVIKPPAPIAAIEFTQSIQQFQLLDDLKNSLMANGEPIVPIISGKPLVMRVYYTSLPTVTHYSIEVTGPLSQTGFFAALPGCEPADQRAKKNPCSSADFYFTPPTGTWSVILVVKDSSGNEVETETLTIKSRDTASINLKALQVCDTNPFGPTKGTICGNPSALFSNWGFLASVMPTNKVTTQLTSLVVTSSTQPYLASSELPFTAWENAVAKIIDGFYSPADQVTDFNLNQRTTYLGFYNPAYDDGGSSVITGHGAIVADSTLYFLKSVPFEPNVIAHETAHTLGLLHTNIPGTPTLIPPGCFGDAKSSTPYWPFATNNLQSFGGPEFGFDVLNQRVKNPNATFDLMSYCYPDWLSPIEYARAITALGAGAVTFPPPGTQPQPMVKSQPDGEASPLAAPTLTTGTYLQVSGDVNATGVELNAIFTQTTSGNTDPGTGTYSIVLHGTSGQTLYTRNFTPAAVENDGSDGATYDSSPTFSEWIPVTAGATSIAVLDPNGIVLANEALTGAAPIVTITSPVAGFAGSGLQTVSWTVQSATATSFNSRIFYSIDGGVTWQLIATTADTSEAIDFSTLAGATAASLRIDVSDGVNTGSATSVPFSVPRKVPSTIVINTPATSSLQLAANPVYLTGAAYDADDGVLQGTALQWSDNQQGALGSGSPLAAKLNAGSHTITLTATDSDGNAITATTQITLAGEPPTVTLSTSNSSASCVNATINASPGSQGASLSLVEYSLDGAITYTAIPPTQLPFTFQVPGSGTVTLIAAAVDASGQLDAQSTVINLGTGCAVTPPVAITPAVTVSPSPLSITTGQSLTVTIGVSGGSGNPTPTGTVTLSSGSYTSAATSLVSGNAMITVPAGSLATSTDTLTATYTPDSNSSSTYNGATGTNTVTVTAVAAATFALANNGPITFETSAATGNTATIIVTPSNGFTGAVTLTCAVTATPANPTSPATCAVTPSVNITGASAQNVTLTVTTTTTTTAGAYAIMVTGTSGAIMMPTILTANVSAYVAPGFALTNSGNITAVPGATTGNSSTITVTPSNGLTGAVALTCAVSPVAANDPATCSLSPASVTINGATAQTSTLTVATTSAKTSALVRPKLRGTPWYAAGGATLACLIFFGIPARRRRWRSILGMIVLLALLTGGIAGCGGKGGGGGGNSGTTAGTYTVTVTGTSGSIMQTTSVTLTVN